MSAIPQPGRTTRITRTNSLKDTENATARPGRTAASRVKPPSNSSSSTTATRATAATAASRAKAAPANANAIKKENGDAAAAHKRKRDALAEGKPKSVAKKETFDGVVLKKTTTVTKETKTTVEGPRVALKTLRGPSSRRNGEVEVKRETREVLAEVKEEEELEMHIDAPAAGSSRDVLPRRAFRVKKEEFFEEEAPVVKKRRTSSEIGEEELREILHEDDALETVIEEEPANDRWDDLDAEDADDPQMVSEYVVEIFQYMKEVEQTTMPNPDYMSDQGELSWKMRGILSDWLIQLHLRFRLLPETLFLAINIMDRFLSARQVSLAKLQLAGIACMFVASKVEEIASPSAGNFLTCAEDNYSDAEMLKAEQYILKSIDWNLSYPNPMHFLRRISKADNYDVATRTVAKYLLEISCVEWRLLATPPSLLAAAAVWLARLVLGRDEWNANLAHYSSYSESDLLPTANIMVNYVVRGPQHEAFFKKYASKRYMKASTFVLDWAARWFNQGRKPDLATRLPSLRAEYAEARALAEKEQARAQDEEEQAAAQAAIEHAHALERRARSYAAHK